MPVFSTAPVDEVAPKRKQRHPSPRAQIQQQYQDALRDAVEGNDRALVVELEGDDKPLTIRNRIKRAAQQIGMEDISIRRRGNRIVAYRDSTSDSA